MVEKCIIFAWGGVLRFGDWLFFLLGIRPAKTIGDSVFQFQEGVWIMNSTAELSTVASGSLPREAMPWLRHLAPPAAAGQYALLRGAYDLTVRGAASLRVGS